MHTVGETYWSTSGYRRMPTSSTFLEICLSAEKNASKLSIDAPDVATISAIESISN